MSQKCMTLFIIIFAVMASMSMLASCGAGTGGGPGQSTSSEQQSEQNPYGTEAQPGSPDQEKEENENQPEEPADKTEAADETEAAGKTGNAEDTEEDTEVNTDNITINTQSSIRIDGSKKIYVDPYKRKKASHDADIIFITHAHYDHYDEPSLRNAAREDSIIVCPASMLADVKRMNISAGKVIGMSAGETEEVGSAVKAEAVPAYNLNKNFHPKANDWLGYIITMDGIRYYAAGDTDALPELEDVDCDIAFVPVGGTYTMTASEAAGLVNKIHPEIAVPIHYGTIVGRAADADTFKNALDKDIQVVKKVEDAR